MAWTLYALPMVFMHFSLDQRSKETTFIHQIFGGYLRSQGWHIGFVLFCILWFTTSALTWCASGALAKESDLRFTGCTFESWLGTIA